MPFRSLGPNLAHPRPQDRPHPPSLPGGLSSLSPHPQSSISGFSFRPQYLQREDFAVVVQPFFRHTLAPLNNVSCHRVGEAGFQAMYFLLHVGFSGPSLRERPRWVAFPCTAFFEYN